MKKDIKNILKKLLQKVTESTSSFMSGVAATAAVVITSVVVLSNVVLEKPTVELLELVEGYNYVEYNISLNDITEGVDKVSELEMYKKYVNDTNRDNSFESYSFDIDVGENKNIVNDLTSNSAYNLSVIGINNENQTEVKYFSTRFFTKNKVKNYKITWMNGDEILEEEYIENGQIPSYDGLAPIKEETIDYIYEFIGWDQEIKEASKDTVYKAVFKEIEKEYNASINLIDESDVITDRTMLAKIAEQLLNIEGMEAAFAIAHISDGVRHGVAISARSYKSVNVQIIMEEMGGGGHLNSAATQIYDVSCSEVKEQLVAILKRDFEIGDEFMKVILLEDVKGRGVKNQVIDVAVGFGNYLISNKKGVLATDDALAKLKEDLHQAQVEAEEQKKMMQKIKEEIEEKCVNIYIKIGADGKLFGHVTTKQIVEEFEAHKDVIEKVLNYANENDLPLVRRGQR